MTPTEALLTIIGTLMVFFLTFLAISYYTDPDRKQEKLNQRFQEPTGELHGENAQRDTKSRI